MTRWATIPKPAGTAERAPNMDDYATTRATFRWEDARRDLAGLPGGRGCNIAHEAVDRHASGPRRHHVALRVPGVGSTAGSRSLTYGELAERSSRFANVLARLGVVAGERVFVLLPRSTTLYVAVLGALKHRCTVAPLFEAFGPEPVRQRMTLGGGSVLVTTSRLYQRRVAPVRHRLPGLRLVLLDGVAADGTPLEGTVDLAPLLAAASGDYEIGPTGAEDMAFLHFTSGTTGTPKGAVHVHDAVVAHRVTAQLALDLRPDDVYWCTADPGWVTGTSYGIVAPLALGVTSIVDPEPFDPSRWYGLLESEGVTVWYTSPTALRMLRQAGPELAHQHDLHRLRFIASVGEPLNPEVVQWGADVLGLPVHDNWWQTETGGIMVANYAGMDIRPGSMGRPMPGIDATILVRDEQGEVVVRDGCAVEAADGEEGELALRPGWPSMFRGYLGDDERYRACFAGGWYLSGDVARRDADGYFWFVGRGDDVIKSAGHLIGPFEVESVLMEHPSVAEAGVIGIPDPVVGEVVKAFVTLQAGCTPSTALRLELIGFARKRLGAAVAPRDVAFDQHLPHTKSGKVLRRLLKARELGLPTGDLSTVEAPSSTVEASS